MISTEWTIKDDEALDLLKRIQDTFHPLGVKAIFEEIGRRISGVLVYRYPPATGAKMSDLWTDKQRRFFFWALREGKIQVPYRRTYALSRLETKLTVKDDSAVLTVGIGESNRARAYAKYVIGTPDEQSVYFRTRTGWAPLAVQLRRQKQDMEGVIQPAVESVLRDIGGLNG